MEKLSNKPSKKDTITKSVGNMMTSAASTELLAETCTLTTCEPTRSHTELAMFVADNMCNGQVGIVRHQTHATRAAKHRLELRDCKMIRDSAYYYISIS
jgi:hypothetical protein